MSPKISEFVKKAIEQCKDGRCFNLILQGVFPIEEINSSFIKAHQAKAEEWQAKQCPESLIINHGEFLHKYGDSIEFLIKELKNKPDSNRAIVSLINCKDILYSGDKPIPSFIVLQFSFIEETCIACTAYFRALEVSKFLPVNLAEICIILSKIKNRFPKIANFNITIHSFSAYSNPEFYCLEVAEMDLIANKGAIAIAVIKNDYNKLLFFLNSKIRDESYVIIDGMIELHNALKSVPDQYNQELINYISISLNLMTELSEIRQSSSHSNEIMILQSKIRDSLSKSINLLEELIRIRHETI